MKKPLLSKAHLQNIVTQPTHKPETKPRQEILKLLRSGELQNLNVRDEEFGMTPLHLITILGMSFNSLMLHIYIFIFKFSKFVKVFETLKLIFGFLVSEVLKNLCMI